MLNKDPDKKKARGYTHPHSFVRTDGSEVLFGNDWKIRKIELLERCKGMCEYRPKGFAGLVQCVAIASDPHHIIPRWPKRDDRLSNLMALCRQHHKLLDKRKIGGRKCKTSQAI